MFVSRMNPPQNSSFYRPNQGPMSGPPMASSTPTSRPRFGFYGPASYPRPRSSASKPNPSPLEQNLPVRNSSYDSPSGYPGDRTCLSDDLDSSYVTCPESPYRSERSFSTENSMTDNYPNSVDNRGCMDSGPPAPSGPVHIIFGPNMEQYQKPPLPGCTNLKPFKTFSRKRKAPSGQPPKHCELCNVDFTSQIPFDMHLRGAKHNKKMKAQETLKKLQIQGDGEKLDGTSKGFYCSVCNLTVNSAIQLQTHYEGAKHKNKLQASAAVTDQEKKSDASVPEQNGKGDAKPTEPLSSKMFCCETCNMTMNSAEELQIHCSDSSHKAKIVQPNPADPVHMSETGEPPRKKTKWRCDVCNLNANSSIQLQQHLDSKKHLAKLNGQPLPSKKKKGSVFAQTQETASSENASTATETISVVPPLSSTFVQSQDKN